MDKLDRQVWAVNAAFNGYGLQIGIRANCERAILPVLETLPPGLKRSDASQVDVLYSVVAGDAQPSKGFRRYSLAYADTLQLARSMDFAGIPGAIEAHLSLHVAEFAKSRVFIHAGVVGWNSKAVLIPGRSLAGKSTLVMALLRAGATYYSDEFALVDDTGHIHPYPSPLKLRNGDGGTRQIEPSELPSGVGKRPLPVGLVLITRHRPDAVWRPRRMSQGGALLHVLENTVSAQRYPGRALQAGKMMVTGSHLLTGPRGDADAMVASLLRAGHLPS
jgi:hypothetical protein